MRNNEMLLKSNQRNLKDVVLMGTLAELIR